MDHIAANFATFHAENPKVYRLFDHFTRQLIKRGYQNGSANLVFERIRWETALAYEGQPVKLNNNYRALYARMWEKDNPEHAGFFRKRVRAENTADAVHFADAVL